MSLKSDYNVIFTLLLPLRLKELLASRPVVDTAVLPSSSDVGMKNLANSLTRDGPMHLRGSS